MATYGYEFKVVWVNFRLNKDSNKNPPHDASPIVSQKSLIPTEWDLRY